ncbi:MAG: CHAP domain-containing protein [Myxococcota bacterium]
MECNTFSSDLSIVSDSHGPFAAGPALKRRLLVHEAERWQGVSAQGGRHCGQVVSLFQGWNDRIERVAWCMAFVQYCLKQADLLYDRLLQRSRSQGRHCVFATQHVMTAWDHTPQQQRRREPQPGFVAVWQRYNADEPTQSGHAGIVVEVLNAQRFVTVEGNTRLACGDPSKRGVQRKRHRYPVNRGPLRLRGFLDPWMLQEGGAQSPPSCVQSCSSWHPEEVS